jgi:putative transposase
MLKRGTHTPAHLLLDDTAYFLTGAIYEKRPLLLQDSLKEKLISLIEQSFAHFAWTLDEWVVLDNHYHLLGRSAKGADLPKVMGRIHSHSATFICEATDCALPVWWNYWDYCPRDEREYRIRQNYLFNNPLKHGYVTDLKQYRFSSFPRLLEIQGREAAARQFRKYGDYRDLVVEEDDF